MPRPAAPPDLPLHVLRARLRRIGWLNSAWHLGIELTYLATMNAGRARRGYERQYRLAEDPWSYDSALQRRRHQDALVLLSRAGVASFRRALEVGCAEGAFTTRLAARCGSVLALDFSATAIRRAVQRCAGQPHVSFLQWDLRTGLPAGNYSLVVAMDVIDSTFGPLALRGIRRTLVSAVTPGGFLLLGNSRQSPLFENSWWGKALVRGGKHINEFVAADPELETLDTSVGEFYVHTLFRRLPANPMGAARASHAGGGI